MFYQGYILPLIDYGTSDWGTTLKSNIEILLKLQKRAAPIILNAPYDTASSDMFKTLGWPTVQKRHSYMYKKAVLTHKALNSLTPTYIIEPQHEISKYVVCATSKASDQPAHTRSLTRAFACRLNIL